MKKFFTKLNGKLSGNVNSRAKKQKAGWQERFNRVFRRWGLAKRLERRRIREH